MRGHTSILVVTPLAAVLSSSSACGDYGRYPEEIAALKVAANESKSNEEALLEIANACTLRVHTDPVLGTEPPSLTVVSGIDSDLHGDLVDKHTDQGSMAMNIEGYRRQLARQAVCMFVAGRSRGLEAIKLRQELDLPLENRRIVTFEIELDHATLSTVEGWGQATFNRDTRWKIYDAVFAAAKVIQDNSGELEIVTLGN